MPGAVMTDIVDRLLKWEDVFPEEAGEAEGSLYIKAAYAIRSLRDERDHMIKAVTERNKEIINLTMTIKALQEKLT
jgi:hypothetical protein